MDRPTQDGVFKFCLLLGLIGAAAVVFFGIRDGACIPAVGHAALAPVALSAIVGFAIAPMIGR